MTLPAVDGERGTALAVASAPVRTADVGGWTDTWFCERGVVCNIALPQRVTVTVRSGRFPSPPDAFLEHLLDAFRHDGLWLDVTSDVTSGSGLGTSAALSVAAVAALSSLTGERLDAEQIAVRAHALEVGSGRQSGVQDHWAAAHGGVSLLHVTYPHCERTEIAVDPGAREALATRLHTVCFATAHSSSDLHLGVIERVSAGMGRGALTAILAAAQAAAEGLLDGDIAAFGSAMSDNHEAIRQLDARLVSSEADMVVDLARSFGALGWKVNGAGGSGGSMAVLGPLDADDDRRLVAALRALPGAHLLSGAIDDRGVQCRVDVAG